VYRELLYIICEIRRWKPEGSPISVYELFNVLHDLRVYKGKSVASDHFLVLDALRYMDRIGWVEFNEEALTIRVSREGRP